MHDNALLDPEAAGSKIQLTENIRTVTGLDDEALSELADSIATHGILVPLLAYAHEDTYQVYDGQRRFLAWQRLPSEARPPVPVQITPPPSSLALQQLLAGQQHGLAPYEEAVAVIRTAYDFGLIHKRGKKKGRIASEEVAKKTATPASRIRKIAAIHGHSDQWEHWQANSHLSLNAAYELLTKSQAPTASPTEKDQHPPPDQPNAEAGDKAGDKAGDSIEPNSKPAASTEPHSEPSASSAETSQTTPPLHRFQRLLRLLRPELPGPATVALWEFVVAGEGDPSQLLEQ